MDIIPGDVAIPTLIGIFLAFDRDAGHLPVYGGKSYHVYSTTEVILDVRNGKWSNARQVQQNKRLHFKLLPGAINFIF